MDATKPRDAVACSKCRVPLPSSLWNQAELLSCPFCQSLVQLTVFPALLRPDTPVARGETILTGEEASCFHHPEKRAVVACEGCGRFLCSLCDVPFQGKHLCPACLHDAHAKGALQILDNRRILFDHVALIAALVPLVLMWPLTFLTAPVAMGVAIYSFRKPLSLVSRTRWRAYVALLLGALQLAAWIWFLAAAVLDSST